MSWLRSAIAPRRDQERRHHAPRRQDGLPRHGPPRHRGLHQLEGARGDQGRSAGRGPQEEAQRKRSARPATEARPQARLRLQRRGLRTVSGQNSNNSVRIPDSFFDARRQGREWKTTLAHDGKVARTLQGPRAVGRDLLRRVALRRPGVQFDTTINAWHTCPARGASTPATRAASTCSSTTRRATWRRSTC
jgi:hypothetical protein